MTSLNTTDETPTQHVCVFCASSNTVDSVYFDAARELGMRLAETGRTLVYGGGKIGLMGELARSVHEGGGKVIGVIPTSLRTVERAYELADELVITQGMRERKAEMDRRSDVFVALPGGFGTLEEIIEVLTARFLGFHDKPVFFLNTNRFYDPLSDLFEHFFSENFADNTLRDGILVVQTVDELFGHPEFSVS